jgi:uncharacterized RDD family membrane protein YckC
MAEVVSGEAVVLDVPVARFPSRILAILLDLLIQVVAALAVLGIAASTQSQLDPDGVLAVWVTAQVLIIVGYPTIFETLSRGKSLGKMALGLRVVSDDGGPEQFRQALVRALASLIEIWVFFGAPALICSMLSAKGKRLGDLFAGTFVIQENLPHRPGLPAWLAVVPPPLAGWAQTLELSGLQDRTAEQAASYLRRVFELSPTAREQLGQQIAAAVAAQVTPPPPPGTPVVPFLQAVLAVRRHREMYRLAAQQGWAGAGTPAPYPPAPYPAAPYPAAAHPAAAHPAAAYPAAPYPAAPYSGAVYPAAPYPPPQPAPAQSAAAPPGPAAPLVSSAPPDPAAPAHPAMAPGTGSPGQDQPDPGGFAPPV